MIEINSPHPEVLLDNMTICRSDHEIKNEPMLFNCDMDNALAIGGDITRDFINCLPSLWRENGDQLVIDSRVHMLMPGWYPCIPGWHHDDVPRSLPGGQPNYDDTLRSEHIIAVINAHVSATEFVAGKAKFSIPQPGQVTYDVWNREVELLVQNGHFSTERVQSGRLYYFTDRTWHRGTAATCNGWRFFIPASMYKKDGFLTTRPNPRTNEERKNAQVYMSALNAGW